MLRLAILQLELGEICVVECFSFAYFRNISWTVNSPFFSSFGNFQQNVMQTLFSVSITANILGQEWSVSPTEQPGSLVEHGLLMLPQNTILLRDSSPKASLQATLQCLSWPMPCSVYGIENTWSCRMQYRSLCYCWKWNLSWHVPGHSMPVWSRTVSLCLTTFLVLSWPAVFRDDDYSMFSA